MDCKLIIHAVSFILFLSYEVSRAEMLYLPTTGQKNCYSEAGIVIPCKGTGQDADTDVGVRWPEQRFIGNNDGTVTDKLTGLMWTKNANLLNGSGTWNNALKYIGGMNIEGAGYKDWRLPNINELRSLNRVCP
jgi:hypothetical protein